MLRELIRAFLLIFAAEMGDKTQIIAMTFATQYLVKDVLIGVTIGVLFNHGIAILLGSFISKVVPIDLIQIAAGFLFVIFGVNALKQEEDEELENKKTLSPINTVALAFFVGELGDKTQLTAMTLSAEANYPFFILMGTTLGMIATSGIGIYVGSKVGDKIPEVVIKIVSSLVFIFFGTLKLFDTLPDSLLTPINILVFFIFLGIIELILISKLIKLRKTREYSSSLQKAAVGLHNQTRALKETLDSICLGEGKCGKCSGQRCIVGYTKFILKDARENDNYYNNTYIDINKLISKNYGKKKVKEALFMIIEDFDKYGWVYDDDFVIMKIRKALEYYLLGIEIKNVKNVNEYVKKVALIDKGLGVELRKRFI